MQKDKSENTRWMGKAVLIAGLGKSGIAAAKYFLSHGANIWLADEGSNVSFPIPDLSPRTYGDRIRYLQGPFQASDFTSADQIILSPGVSFQHPVILAARRANIPVDNEAGIAFHELGCRTIVVTGTSGKTTTASLIHSMLSGAGESAELAGNIGTPLLELVLAKKNFDWLVAELSSFQLEVMSPFVPVANVYLPIYEDHLDRHASMEEYVAAKARLLSFGNQHTMTVLRWWNPWHQQILWKSAPGDVYFTVREDELEGFPQSEVKGFGVYYKSRQEFGITLGGKEERFAIPEQSRAVIYWENFLAALVTLRALGIESSKLTPVLESFKGIPHRLEFVGSLGDIEFYNDSKATNVASATHAVQTLSDRPIIWIVGGKDKQIDYSPLAPLAAKYCRHVVGIGEAKEKLREVFKSAVMFHSCDTLEQAVRTSLRIGRPGDRVLLAPACASLDMFKGYEDRGNQFKDIIRRIMHPSET